VPSPGIIVGDKYRLEEPIGEGGMATVWRAVHTTLDRAVAVKFLEAVGTHAQSLAERFLREAKLAAGIRHRHVVDIIDFGVTDEGQPFMVMEFLEGQSLAERYTEGPPVTDWELLEIVAMILGGLAAVHDAGILHRDVKPENIFLVRDSDGMYPKLIDFGVSKGFQSGDRITRTGAVVGTPEYMSPEQARGLKEIDQRSDLFAIGVVLYEGLCGETPFESENPGDVLIRVATEDAAPLSERRPDLPPELVSLVHLALQKDPNERFGDARSMRDAVHAVMQSPQPLEGRPDDRNGFGPAPGSGLIRVISSRPPASGEVPVPLLPAGSVPPSPPMPPTPRPSGKTPPPPPPAAKKKKKKEIRPEDLDTSEIEVEKLPDLRPLPPKQKRRGRWAWPLMAIVLLGAGAGAFFAFDGMTLVEQTMQTMGASDDPAAQGELRPGRDVAALSDPEPAGDVERTDIAFDPPPADGAGAPDSETIDVPSPPDPPDAVDELPDDG